MDRNNPPNYWNNKDNVLPEPEYGQLPESYPRQQAVASTSASKPIICYNCNQPGHRFYQCNNARGSSGNAISNWRQPPLLSIPPPRASFANNGNNHFNGANDRHSGYRPRGPGQYRVARPAPPPVIVPQSASTRNTNQAHRGRGEGGRMSNSVAYYRNGNGRAQPRAPGGNLPIRQAQSRSANSHNNMAAPSTVMIPPTMPNNANNVVNALNGWMRCSLQLYNAMLPFFSQFGNQQQQEQQHQPQARLQQPAVAGGSNDSSGYSSGNSDGTLNANPNNQNVRVIDPLGYDTELDGGEGKEEGQAGPVKKRMKTMHHRHEPLSQPRDQPQYSSMPSYLMDSAAASDNQMMANLNAEEDNLNLSIDMPGLGAEDEDILLLDNQTPPPTVPFPRYSIFGNQPPQQQSTDMMSSDQSLANNNPGQVIANIKKEFQ